MSPFSEFLHKVLLFSFISVHGLLDKEPAHLRDELMPLTLPKTCTHSAHSRCSVDGGGRDSDEKMGFSDLSYSIVSCL